MPVENGSPSPQARAARERLGKLLDEYSRKEPLVEHAAVTEANRTHAGKAVDSCTATETWRAENTERALVGIAFEEHVGLRFYLEDPIPKIRARCFDTGHQRFVDHEFRVDQRTTVRVPSNISVRFDGNQSLDREGFRTVITTPGIITDTNCEDFVIGGAKRALRIPRFVESASTKWKWMRGSDRKDYALFVDPRTSVHPSNVLQGKIGNCGFCSGFASIAAVAPKLFVDAFGAHSIASLQTCGVVSIKVFPRGRPRYLLLDDYVLCCSPSGSPPSMRSLNENDLWIRLVEKAFVKIQGSYASLDGHYKYKSLYRHPARAMQLITGARVAFELRHRIQGNGTKGGTGDEVHKESVYRALVKTQGSYARVGHCRSAIGGLLSNHGYSLLWVGSVLGVRLAFLRNPHGRRSYWGPFGYGNSAWRGREDVQEALVQLNEFEMDTQTGRVRWRGSNDVEQLTKANRTSTAIQQRNLDDDGFFFIEFALFLRCFPIVTIVGPIANDGRWLDEDDASSPSYHVQIVTNVDHANEILDAANATLW